MKKVFSIIIAFILIISSFCFAFATEGQGKPIEIYTLRDFENIKNDPYGSYVLMNDIDFAGDLENREPFAFYGKLDGNGHKIYNICSVSSSDYKIVYDANLKEYEGLCAGLFTIIENAEITDLNIYNIDVSLGVLSKDSDKSMYLGSIAGYAFNSKIINCNISGKVSATTSGHCFGVGGVFGFTGNCIIQNCSIDTTLICVDLDKSYKDEQFMGGVYSFGYCDVLNSKIKVYGYDSDHGYVHNGGIVGCFMYYDKLHVGETVISGNSVKGRIRFFEDNKDRRAYCRAYGGEMMSWDLTMENNTADFIRDEVYVYDEILLPENEFEGQLVNNTDVLLLSSHADDEQLFFAGLLPYYSIVRGLNVQVVYATDNSESSGRIQERENALFAVGIKHKCDSFGYPDLFSESKEGALKSLSSYGISEEDIINDIHNMILKYQPKVIVTHDVNGEYSHGMHILVSSCIQRCLELHSSEYGFLQKVYLHLYDDNQISLDVIDEQFDELDGLSPFQYTQEYGFALHKSQHWTWFYGWIYGKNGNTITKASEIRTYSPLKYGLVYGDGALDESHNDVFEGVQSYKEEETQAIKDYAESLKKQEEERLREENEARLREEERIKALEREATIKKIIIISSICIIIAIIVILLKKRSKNIRNQ